MVSPNLVGGAGTDVPGALTPYRYKLLQRGPAALRTWLSALISTLSSAPM